MRNLFCSGTTFHIVAGNTSRFLVSQDCTKDIGDIVSVSFRWERPTCWMYYFCKSENVYLRRMKIFDASAQKRHVFLPMEMDRNHGGRKEVFKVPAGKTQKLLKKSHISRHHRSKFVPVIVPELMEVGGGKVISSHKKRRMLKRLSHRAKHWWVSFMDENMHQKDGEYCNHQPCVLYSLQRRHWCSGDGELRSKDKRSLCTHWQELHCVLEYRFATRNLHVLKTSAITLTCKRCILHWIYPVKNFTSKHELFLKTIQTTDDMRQSYQ